MTDLTSIAQCVAPVAAAVRAVTGQGTE
jgi:hypothetical protein